MSSRSPLDWRYGTVLAFHTKTGICTAKAMFLGWHEMNPYERRPILHILWDAEEPSIAGHSVPTKINYADWEIIDG